MIRPYATSDKAALLKILRSNTPIFFAPSEEKDFEIYLKEETEDYFVLEENGQILGCGGINYFPDEEKARISWDMVDSEYHGKGIGNKLMHHRINILKSNLSTQLIEVRTSQHAYLFYEKMGFELNLVEDDFWAEGFDLYLMSRLNLNI